ncbi:MAG TPA: ABC transporter ATP-binding protein [Gammaproteobacteria bacterium]
MTLVLDRVAVRYGARVALRPTTLELPPGLVGLVGPNGAGKSSLLKAVAGLLRHDGAVSLNGTSIDSLRARERARTIAYLPQSPAAHWPMRGADLVALGRMPHLGFGERLRHEDVAAIEWALDQCDAAPFAERAVDRLSGGERARVLLARALAVRAPVLLADEPIQSLDPYHQLKIMHVLRDYAAAGRTVVAVLHDVALAARFCSRVVLLDRGGVACEGAPEEVLTTGPLGRHYRIEPYLARHRGAPVVVPWRQLDS